MISARSIHTFFSEFVNFSRKSPMISWVKKTQKFQISLVFGRNPQWFLQAYFWIFVRISSISCRNHQWFLQEKNTHFFRISRFFAKITNDLCGKKKTFFFRIPRFLAEITIDFRRKKNPKNSWFSQYRGDPSTPQGFYVQNRFSLLFFLLSQKPSKKKLQCAKSQKWKFENLPTYATRG